MGDQFAAFLADNPETLGFAVDALVRLPPSTVPGIHVVFVPIEFCFGSF